MNKLLMTTTAAAGFLALALSVAPASAVEVDCGCVPNALDALQRLDAAQKATNKIDDFKTVSNVVQSATNIGNSIDIDNLDSLPQMNSLRQDAWGYQWASNYIEFGGGGYNGPEYKLNQDGELVGDPSGNALDHTQSALNAVNLINVPTLGRPVYQENSTFQGAINTARFEGHTYGFGWSGDVDDLTQSATNVANSISTNGFYTFVDCDCLEIEQISDGKQVASNWISGASSYGFGSLNEAIQNATNVANSISGSLPEN